MVKTINRFDAAVNMVPKEGISILHVDVEDAPFYIQYDTLFTLVFCTKW